MFVTAIQKYKAINKVTHFFEEDSDCQYIQQSRPCNRLLALRETAEELSHDNWA